MVNSIIKNEHIVGAPKCGAIKCVSLVVTLSRLTTQPPCCVEARAVLPAQEGLCTITVGKW